MNLDEDFDDKGVDKHVRGKIRLFSFGIQVGYAYPIYILNLFLIIV